MNTTSSPLPGPKTLLFGPAGSGKTSSLRTLIDAGITPFCVFTEPGFEVIGDIPDDKLHWHYVPPAGQDLTAMIEMAENINRLSFEALTKMTTTDRKKYNQFVDVLKSIQDFKCDRCGKSYGDATRWNTDRALVLDSLSGINTMAMALVVGGKPVRSMADWMVAQNTLEALLQKLTTDMQAFLVVIAHPERETDEVLGGSKVMVSTLGKKLAPKIPRFFSDVVLSEKVGTKFTWSTASATAELKNRNLPNADNLAPDFRPLVEKWKQQGGIVVPTQGTVK